MNNKQIGNEFERQCCEILSKDGWWVHFISPNRAGAQPFDIIAVRDGEAAAIDCKTTTRPIFPLSRLEDNQVLAFEKWSKCGNANAGLLIKWRHNVYFVEFERLLECGKVDLREQDVWRYLNESDS